MQVPEGGPAAKCRGQQAALSHSLRTMRWHSFEPMARTPVRDGASIILAALHRCGMSFTP
jgi:hypothetical protein